MTARLTTTSLGTVDYRDDNTIHDPPTGSDPATVPPQCASSDACGRREQDSVLRRSRSDGGGDGDSPTDPGRADRFGPDRTHRVRRALVGSAPVLRVRDPLVRVIVALD